MKKLILMVLCLMVVAAPVFAGGGRPPDSPCITNCKIQNGDPFAPNHPYELDARSYITNPDGTIFTNYKLDENGLKIPFEFCQAPKKKCGYLWWTYDCPCYDPSKKTYDPNGYAACQKGC